MNDISDISFRHLQYFAAIVEYGTLGKAAEILHVSQSGMSQRIVQLEEMIGLPLFERKKQRLVLTPAGKQLYNSFNSVMMLMTTSLREAHLKFDRNRALTIGFSSYQGSEITRVIVNDFRKTFSEFDFTIELHQRTRLVEEFIQQHIDIVGITDFEGLRFMPGIFWKEAGRVPIGCYFGIDSPLARNTSIGWADLDNVQCVFPEHQRGGKLVHDIEQKMRQIGAHLNISYHSGDIITVRSFVENNDVVTFAGVPAQIPETICVKTLPDIDYPYIVACYRHLIDDHSEIAVYVDKLRDLIRTELLSYRRETD